MQIVGIVVIGGGITCSFSKPSAHTPMMKPNRLKVSAVSTRKPNIHSGCAISYGTKARAVSRISRPSSTDLLAAAPT
ncbi:hypothetical protein NB693_21520 [Pantoea ananatis]|nr:hypothetical protein [Pantoea ananatis]